VNPDQNKSLMQEARYVLINFGFDINVDDAKRFWIQGLFDVEKDIGGVTDYYLNNARKSLQGHDKSKNYPSKKEIAIIRTVNLLKDVEGREIFREALKHLSRDDLLSLLGTRDGIDEGESN